MSLQTLIVDDDALICFIHKKVLKSAGIQDANTFSNGQDALGFLTLHYHPENQYLVFLDINMPVMNGWEFLQELRRDLAYSNIHVFIVSSSVQDADKNKCRLFSQVSEYIEKPLKPENLQGVRAFLANHRFTKAS
jgi:CheY-like chemotaxis protein